jgi:hypothetical protein
MSFMRWLARLLLGLVTSAVPVVIAACYGSPHRSVQRGRVIDKNTRAGVAGLLVECRTGTNVATDTCYSGADGSFNLMAIDTADCAIIDVKDEREAGSHYAPTTALPDPKAEIIIEVSSQSLPPQS